MRLVFVGPTVPDARAHAGRDVTIMPPARQGDVLRAERNGANVIGIVDGTFEYGAPVWHKEILWALSKGVHVFGAASMGALRAAECDAFGMIGIGDIYRRYAAGELEDDSDVAQMHAPGELGFSSLTEPLVNIIATLRGLATRSLIMPEEEAELAACARGLFFKDRTLRRVVAGSRFASPDRRAEILSLMQAESVPQKRLDALELIAAVAATPDARGEPSSAWSFAETSLWHTAFSET